MKNLIHVDIEILEQYPAKHIKYSKMTGRGLLSNRGVPWNWKRYRSGINSVSLIQNIIEGSVGRNFGAVVNKLKENKDIPTCVNRFTIAHWADRFVPTAYTYINHIPYVAVRYYGDREYFGYYVDRKSNIAYRRKNYKNYSHNYGKKYYYEKRAADRKKERDKRKNIQHKSINFISQSTLYSYYTSLIKTRDLYILRASEKEPVEPKQYILNCYNKMIQRYNDKQFKQELLHYRLNVYNWKKNKEKAIEELPSIYDLIQMIDDKNYSEYLKSDIYIKSVQKECHHFEQNPYESKNHIK